MIFLPAPSRKSLAIKLFVCVLSFGLLDGCGGGSGSVTLPVSNDFPALNKTMGDAPFALATPVSTDPAPFTYTSENTAVATIAGSTVTIVGAGVTKITAIQLKNNFPIVTKTALLTVAPGAIVPAPVTKTLALALDSASALPAFGGRNIGVTLTSSATGAVAGTTIDLAASCGTIAPARVVTDSAGSAIAQFSANPTSNDGCGGSVVTITATASAITPATGTITVQPALPPTLQLNVGSGAALPAFGTRAVVATVNANGAKAPVDVNFSASCGSVAPAKVTADSSGIASTTFLANSSANDGCGARNVVITATAAGATPVSAGFAVQAALATNLQFVAATPQLLYLFNSGGSTMSQVSFRVLGANGAALGNQAVRLSLSNRDVGVALGAPGNQAALLLNTGSDGQVSAAVFAGTIPTSVRINAALVADPTIAASSNALVIASGVPVQKSVTLALEKTSIEGLSNDGVSSKVTFSMADRQGNPVPVGTTVNFVSSHGVMVPGTCTVPALADGSSASACSVAIRSQGARPASGKVVILAYAIGEEDFTDLNGNNLYDSGEPFTVLGNVFRDDDLNNRYDKDQGEFTVPRAAELPANSPACATSTLNVPSRTDACNIGWGTIDVRFQQTVIFASGDAQITPASTSIATGPTVIIKDARGNSMPTGTTISATGRAASGAGACSATALTSTVPNTVGPLVVVLRPLLCAPNDFIDVIVTSPLGVVTNASLKLTQ